MNLPFLKPKRSEPTLIIKTRSPDGTMPESHSDDSEDAGLIAASEDLCKAIESKDYTAIAKAWRAGFEILESQPHDEAEQPNESME